MRLAGEVALVTGSTSGVGRGIALGFGAEGARVVVTGRDPERGSAVVSAIADKGGDATFLAADLLREDACTELVSRTVERYGTLTVLVNSAVGGTGGRDNRVGELETAAWEGIMRVNLTAPMMLCRAAIPHMIAAGHGSIVNISSRAATRVVRNLPAYAASKSGLEGLTRSIAFDYGAQGIRANALALGYVLNDRRDANLTEERRRELEAMHVTRLATAEDIAYAAVFLASRESEYLTGVTIPLDGGSSFVRGRTLG